MKIARLLLLFFLLPAICFSQEKTNHALEKALKSIADFQLQESRADSANGYFLGGHTEARNAERNIFYTGVYHSLEKIHKLSFDDSITLELLKYDIEEELSYYKYKMYLNPLLADEGFHTWLAALGSEKLSDKKEYELYILKLKDMPRYVNGQLELIRKGLSEGYCLPRSILDGYENTYNKHIVTDATASVFYKPFLNRPAGVAEADWTALQQSGKDAVMQYAVPSYQSIKTFFDNEYLPKTRTTIGVSNFPDGLAFYQDRVKHYTSTDISYEDIYQLGLNEVARIKKEMMQVLIDVQYKGSLQEFIGWLRSAPQFYATTPDALLKEAAFIAKKADGMLPAFFGKLPRQPYDVEAVPEHLAPTYTAGRYAGTSIYGKNAAHYWVNTYDLKSRPFYNLEALTMHEAVPGHHLQLALAQELNGLHPFRRNIYVNAFGEGWGLYAEWLGTEMGFYKDPYSHFGKLTYEMWRACRLVIDVGLHTKNWTREQAVKYLAENTALSLHEVNTEINRYISWPGQALAYKVGELKIRELRKKAEAALKEKFDIREFHDLILSQGSVTMKILERMVERYIERKLAMS